MKTQEVYKKLVEFFLVTLAGYNNCEEIKRKLIHKEPK